MWYISKFFPHTPNLKFKASQKSVSHTIDEDTLVETDKWSLRHPEGLAARGVPAILLSEGHHSERMWSPSVPQSWRQHILTIPWEQRIRLTVDTFISCSTQTRPALVSLVPYLWDSFKGCQTTKKILFRVTDFKITTHFFSTRNSCVTSVFFVNFDAEDALPLGLCKPSMPRKPW